MKCPYCNNHQNVVKAGLRTVRQGTIQKYYCKKCKKYFTDKTQPHTQYPLHVILYTLQSYNQGYPVKKAKTLTGKKYRYSPPIRTIYSWITRYQDILTFLRLRKKYTIDPTNLTTTHRLKHQQIYPFTYHNLKLNLSSKQLPQLRRYINWVERHLPHKLFHSGPRASQATIQEPEKNTLVQQKDNNALQLARFALNTQPKNQSNHEIIEQFFLLNDSTTICTELPVFLNPKETQLFDIEQPLTGHIDLVQIRYGKIYIMDYKPNLRHPEQHAGQLMAYKQAVHKRTSIPEENMVSAVFNRHGYFEFR